MRKIILGLAVLSLSTSLFATPEFAREQEASCTVCHTSSIPALNATGESFLRNGFRFSSQDKTTIDRLKDGKTIPLAVMLRESYSSQTEDDSQKVKLYAGASLTKNLSFFAVTQEIFNTNDNSNAPTFFDEKSSRAYFQLNLQDDKHVIRFGLMSPFTQLGNLQRIFSDSGLQGGNTHSQDSSYQSSRRELLRRYGNGNQSSQNIDSTNNQQHDQNANQPYKTPLNQSAFGKYKGLEYSYLFNSKWMFLFSYGEPVEEEHNSHSGSNGYGQNYQQNQSTDDEYQFIGGVQYRGGDYKIGLLYNKSQRRNQDTYSFILPFEKSFEKFSLYSAIVYKDADMQESYIGIENAILYPINDTSSIRVIFNADEDEDNNNNYGYSLTYSKLFKSRFLFRVTGAKKDTSEIDDEYIKLSVSMFL